MDRVARGRRAEATRRASDDLMLVDDQLIQFSAKTGEGKEALLEALEHLLEEEEGPNR
jgi:hypothetical protein